MSAAVPIDRPMNPRMDAALDAPALPQIYKFRLFIAGHTPNSVHALANLTALCRAHLPNHHEIEVVDVFVEPERALSEEVFMTPTLIKLAPLPIQKIVGTLSNANTVLQMLGLKVPG